MKEKQKLCNLLSDFIMLKMGESSQTKIQVCDCQNFYVIKGKTSQTEILNLNEVLENFYKKYDFIESKQKNVIDLIEYDRKPELEEELVFKFQRKENRSNHDIQSGPYIFTSHFPYGYSLSNPRTLYYYIKHIVYNIPENYFYNKIEFKFNFKSEDLDFVIWDDFNSDYTDSLKSSILDIFDFNLVKFTEDLKKMDLDIELLNPLEDISLLKEKVKDFIII